MKNSCVAWLVGLTLGFSAWGLSAGAQDGAPAGADTVAAVTAKPQTTCPVMAGNAIHKKYFADYKGKRIYFCCGACPRLFAKDPGKYMKKLLDEGIALEDTPAGTKPAEGPGAGESHSH